MAIQTLINKDFKTVPTTSVSSIPETSCSDQSTNILSTWGTSSNGGDVSPVNIINHGNLIMQTVDIDEECIKSAMLGYIFSNDIVSHDLSDYLTPESIERHFKFVQLNNKPVIFDNAFVIARINNIKDDDGKFLRVYTFNVPTVDNAIRVINQFNSYRASVVNGRYRTDFCVEDKVMFLISVLGVLHEIYYCDYTLTYSASGDIRKPQCHTEHLCDMLNDYIARKAGC